MLVCVSCVVTITPVWRPMYPMKKTSLKKHIRNSDESDMNWFELSKGLTIADEPGIETVSEGESCVEPTWNQACIHTY